MPAKKRHPDQTRIQAAIKSATRLWTDLRATDLTSEQWEQLSEIRMKLERKLEAIKRQ